MPLQLHWLPRHGDQHAWWLREPARTTRSTTIGVGLIALGYALYYGLQAGGMEAGYAGGSHACMHGCED